MVGFGGHVEPRGSGRRSRRRLFASRGWYGSGPAGLSFRAWLFGAALFLATVDQTVAGVTGSFQDVQEGTDIQAVIDGGIVQVRYWPGGERLARRLLDQADRGLPFPALPAGVLGQGPPITVYLAPDERRFDSLTVGRAPEWSAGVAVPASHIIVIPAYPGRTAPHELHRVLRHELAHVALHRHLSSSRIPRWFDEGYARWAAGEWGRDTGWKLRLAFALNRAPSLDSLTLSWPVARVDAEIAYQLATSAVAYLIEQSGEHGLRLFLENWRASGSFQQALWGTYGLTPGQLELHWSRWVQRRYGWALLLSNYLIFWFLAALLLLALFGLRRKRDDERYRLLQAGEPPDEPAYWRQETDDSPDRFG